MSEQVLILGGGMAGVACAQELAKKGVPVTLVDRNDYDQFQPLLYQVATSQLPAQDIARPHRAIFAKSPSVVLRNDEVKYIKPASCELVFANGDVLSGTHLVIAAGARPNFFGVPGAPALAYPLYSVADAERLRGHLKGLIDESAKIDHHGSVDATAMSVVVVGAGPTGVELAGALAELMEALASTHTIAHAGTITLVEHGDSVLGPFSKKAQRYAHEHLSKKGVTLKLGRSVAGVSADGVTLDDGATVTAQTVVWAGGELGSSALGDSELPLGHGARVDVNPDLSVPGFPGVYGVGDAANIPGGDGHVLPQLGSVAQQSGAWAGQNILKERDGKDPLPFHYKDKGIMAMIGRNSAVAELGTHRHEVDGPLAFGAWLGVHALLLSGAHDRTNAFVSWAWDYFDRDHSAMVEATSTPPRIAWGDDEDEPHIVVDVRSAPTPASSN